LKLIIPFIKATKTDCKISSSRVSMTGWVDEGRAVDVVYL